MNNKNTRINFSIFFTIFLLTHLFSFNSYGQKSHIGIWKGADNGQIGMLDFKQSGFVTLELNNEIIGGEKFSQNGIDAQLTYSIDYNSKPIKIDFIVSRLDTGKEVGRLLGIIEFIGDTRMKVRINFDNPVRPLNFKPEGNSDTIILEKVK